MIILALDTSTTLCSLAVCEDNKIIAFQQSSEAFAHNGLMFEMLDKLLAEAKITMSQVDYLAVGQGPGSFTGLRIGVSAWKSIAFAANIPLLPICSLKTAAYTKMSLIKEGETIRAFIDARQSDAFTALYKMNNHTLEVIDPIKVVNRKELPAYKDYTIACGNLPNEAIESTNYYSETFPSAIAIAQLAFLDKNKTPTDKFFEPAYYKEFKLHTK